ncbi:MAG: Gx transporter family protein [Acetobacter sp.]|nr:Gx transporter family protein [Bacteroides sp.]MCM1341235.1 Gx transporter family protein [Acetobacter sp.]MCM1433878.1 Gx transporter family protein [Clostridiales bacterium]
MKKNKVKHIALFGMMVALAFTFSYLESLIPFNFGIPGIKLGLANLVVVIALYTMKPGEAFSIVLIRVFLAGLTFGNAYSIAYSLCGGVLSFAVMLLVKKTKLSVIGVSMLGGICHNIGQIIVAAIIMNTKRIAYYLPVLLVAGVATGLLIGIVSKLTVERIEKVKNNNFK